MVSQFRKYSKIHRTYHAQFAWRCVLRLVFAAFVVGISLPCRAADDPEGEMAEIVAAHKHWRESIVSVRMVWEVVADPQSQFAKDNGSQGIERRDQTEFIWCDDGRRRVYTFSPSKDGLEIGRSLRCADGKQSFSVMYPYHKSDPENPDRVEVMPQSTPGEGGLAAYVPLLGLWYGSRNCWLSDMLSRKFVTFDGYENVDGETLPRIKVERATGTMVSSILAPNHGYLPRRFVEADWQHEITSYRLVDPGIWFPWAGEFHTKSDRQTWEMKEIQVNSNLNSKLFQPPIGPRTLVIDAVTGKRSGPGAANAQSAAQTPQTYGSKDNAVTARPPDTEIARRVLIVSFVSIAFFGIGAWLKRRA